MDKILPDISSLTKLGQNIECCQDRTLIIVEQSSREIVCMGNAN